ncbi:hypothetical protein LY76DRAFT_152594 [Colletotrichum caudatum]|nr:hypothetical protein LY76DRAFT_152594 [Colletotrichum caudatum]
MRFAGFTALIIVALMAATGMANRPEQVPGACWNKCSKECIAWIVPFFLLFPKFIDCRKQCIIGMYHPECREMLKQVKIGS